ncbi:MFS general substrate transporter [Aspergillus steynii IBT 23096]|uniref:MFS general substrate transporter n=1 Tax=Aspergillus steynii IBT 23096 TaxID=1392250 RepID=A0A2I2GHW7_9EURO|nr:MFS general substrate transporter [Aspergillus steynii IBT 23096]PLB52472.1 MFS general substrate transporter [Aspergillus steynii IBT 23096]
MTPKKHPRDWSPIRKVITTIIICGIGFTVTVGASIYSPGHEQVQQEFNVPTTISLLPLSAYSLGLAFGPMISSPLSEAFGRRFVYLITLPLFDIFMVGVGLSRNIASLIICRFFAGLFAAPGVSVAAATIADYTTPSERAIPLCTYYSIPFTGSAIGPLIGGFAVDAKEWRWTAWVVLIMGAALHTPVLFLRESQTSLSKGNSDGGVWETGKHFITTTVIRPLHMLTTEPLVTSICLYTGFQFALLYTFVVASPWVFRTVYAFSSQAQSLSFLGMVTGCLTAPPVLISIDRLIKRLRPPTSQTPSTPEDRLHAALYGSLVLPAGLFWFAWTAQPSIHWMSPICAQGLTLLGSILIYVPCNFYTIDVYGSKFGASASGASSLTRYTLSAAFPLFVTQMYEALGVHWATSLLGFVALAMAPIPWLLYRAGPGFRARSGYEHGT